MRKSILCEALNIATSKIDRHPEYDYYIHFTFIVQDNKIIEWGRNNKGIPAKHFGYHDRVKNLQFAPKMHSELDAYRKAKGLLNKNKSFSAINIRLNKSRKLRISKPCSCCYGILKAFGCSGFYYSSNIGFLFVR
jgi:tRNA(Arg) A34 adenosine deaminase TadA